MGAVIEVEGVSKSYGAVEAVKALTFSVPAGQICGYLGANGAGKTTTLKLLTGLLAPSAGTIRIAGHDLAKSPLEARRSFGFCPDSGALFPLLTAREHLQLMSDLHELEPAKAAAKTDELLALFELQPLADRTIDTLSKGQRQKVALANALLHEPPVLFLDEPLNGLDVSAVRAFKMLVQQHAKAGGAVLFSTHILDVVERICHRTIIIHKGQLVADAPTAELLGRSKDATLESVFAELTSVPAPVEIRRAFGAT